MPPGGRVEPGESYEKAALRELREEVALHEVDLGSCVWLRTFPFGLDGKRYTKEERYFLFREHFEIDASSPVDPEGVLGYKWWSVDGIKASSDLFVPRALGRLLIPLLEGESPEEPIVVDI